MLVVAFAILSPGDDDPATTTPPATTPEAPPTSTAPAPPPAANLTSIVVRAGKPIGGVKKIKVTRGERALTEVSSPDTFDEIHIHGYDLMEDLKAGGQARFVFTANAEGVFEIELENAGAQIAELVVEPG